MLDTLANTAVPIKDERRQSLLKGEAEKLAEQARLILVGPDLERFDDHIVQFNRTFW